MTALRNISADENKQFWLLRRYLRQRKVSRHLSDRIVKYLEFQQITKQNIVAPHQVALLNKLSDQFKIEIAHEMFSGTLSAHPFFQYMISDPILQKSMQRLCFSSFKVLPSAAFERLFYLGDEGQTMFFVKAGGYEYRCIDNRPLDKELEPRHWVAEPVLWTCWRHRGTLMATTPSEALALSATAFSGTLRTHPKPWYLGMRYGVNFVNYLNRCPFNALTDVMFDAQFFVANVKESDTYVLARPPSVEEFDFPTDMDQDELAAIA
jgi:hypothetical protein